MKWIKVSEQQPKANSHVLVYKGWHDDFGYYDDCYGFAYFWGLDKEVQWTIGRDYAQPFNPEFWCEFPEFPIFPSQKWDRCNQPERSKREDLKCDNCKIPRVFNCCGYPHKNDESCDEYNFKMRCSEHCGNTVRGK